MSNQILNLFPISNLQQLRCKYHLLEVKNLPRNTMYSENLERLATMAAKESRSPVSIFHENQKTYLATTGDPALLKREWRLIPNIALLEDTGREHELRLAAPLPEERHL